ncbi:MAG: S8 family serine peptidase [Bacteroidetes bacterium]|nr:S8 family serine peptidase [Bacteroidota bacterium]
MKKRILLPALQLFIFFSFMIISPCIKAQASTQKAKLFSIAAVHTQQVMEKKAAAEAWAAQNNFPVRKELENGSIIELQFVQDGIPFYYTTNNTEAAVTTRTYELWPGGSLGLSFTGAGYTGLGIWDGGAVMATHQEFMNNGVSRVTQMDGAIGYVDHSTHVAGTLIAAGVMLPAKGMAFEGTLKAWDWNNDASEMAMAAANGLEISNHSYGYSRGWTWMGSGWAWFGNSSISTAEDYQFGFYTNSAQLWDQIAYYAPYYLIVKAAGNDRGEGPTGYGVPYPVDGAPSGFDCIGDIGVAKNILTVGAVNYVQTYQGPSSVIISSFSGWGPADDGRIKPDIVADGVNIFSTIATSTTSYTGLSGTSMAAPNASGTLALLQQYYKSTHDGVSMQAATLKGLAIHTTDECGSNPGPDYIFGWGLLDAANAATVITNDVAGNAVINELSLENGGVYTLPVYSDGSQPLVVTICWTDPAGTPPAPSLDPITPMLVNDLDVKVTGNSTTYYPWKLDRNNPSAAATRTSKNYVDNVEVVRIDAPVAGTYTIVVNHAGVLADPQDYSLIITGMSSGQTKSPVAAFTASATNICSGSSVTFTDQSANIPVSWSWQFPGGTPSTSTLKNPVVVYTTAGIYDVTLTASNASGSNTMIKAGYITVTKPVSSYCNSHGNATAQWIALTKIGTTSKTSGSSGTSGYQDFTASKFTLVKGTNTLTLTPGFSGTSNNEYWCVWIDYNQDGDFTESGELVFSVSKKKTTVTGSFTLPATALTGDTRIRVSMKKDKLPTACEIFTAGEVEDYTVTIPSIKNSLADENLLTPDNESSSKLTSKDIILYPNPVKDELNITLLHGAETSKVSVISMQGVKVGGFELKGQAGVIDARELPAGLYLILVETNGQAVYKKFIKQ